MNSIPAVIAWSAAVIAAIAGVVGVFYGRAAVREAAKSIPELAAIAKRLEDSNILGRQIARREDLRHRIGLLQEVARANTRMAVAVDQMPSGYPPSAYWDALGELMVALAAFPRDQLPSSRELANQRGPGLYRDHREAATKEIEAALTAAIAELSALKD